MQRSKKLVMVIDDRMSVHLGIKKYLNTKKYELLEPFTNDCTEAEGVFKSRKPDIVIMDYDLGPNHKEINGITLAQAFHRTDIDFALLMMSGPHNSKIIESQLVYDFLYPHNEDFTKVNSFIMEAEKNYYIRTNQDRQIPITGKEGFKKLTLAKDIIYITTNTFGGILVRTKTGYIQSSGIKLRAFLIKYKNELLNHVLVQESLALNLGVIDEIGAVRSRKGKADEKRIVHFKLSLLEEDATFKKLAPPGLKEKLEINEYILKVPESYRVQVMDILVRLYGPGIL